MSPSDIAVIVTSFERPASLARALLSLSLQKPGDALAEIVVADDGSRDHTWQVVDRFARVGTERGAHDACARWISALPVAK